MVIAVIVFFILMGLVALAAPQRVTAIFGMPQLTPEGRNEVRAVYGGFGIAIGAVLTASLYDGALRPGVPIAVAAALLGMAGGRVVSALFERPRRFYPAWFFCLAETVMGLILWHRA